MPSLTDSSLELTAYLNIVLSQEITWPDSAKLLKQHLEWLQKNAQKELPEDRTIIFQAHFKVLSWLGGKELDTELARLLENYRCSLQEEIPLEVYVSECKKAVDAEIFALKQQSNEQPLNSFTGSPKRSDDSVASLLKLKRFLTSSPNDAQRINLFHAEIKNKLPKSDNLLKALMSLSEFVQGKENITAETSRASLNI